MRGNESQIKDVTHYWREWHRPVFIGSSSGRLRQPMCFLFSIQEIVSGHAGASAPDKPAALFALFIFQDDGFAQSPVAVTVGPQSKEAA